MGLHKCSVNLIFIKVCHPRTRPARHARLATLQGDAGGSEDPENLDSRVKHENDKRELNCRSTRFKKITFCICRNLLEKGFQEFQPIFVLRILQLTLPCPSLFSAIYR